MRLPRESTLPVEWILGAGPLASAPNHTLGCLERDVGRGGRVLGRLLLVGWTSGGKRDERFPWS
jgi:hypothetical protein